MNKKLVRQNEIISFMKEEAEMSVSDILSFLSLEIDRKTLQRDLKELEKQLLIFKKGIGKNTVYSLTVSSNVLKEVNVKEYFKIPYLKRETKESFNFDAASFFQNEVSQELNVVTSYKSFPQYLPLHVLHPQLLIDHLH
jgi:DNA-binding HxlR family transcriptional regulator